MIYSFDIGSSSAKIIGYQVIAGAGNGIIVQVPVIVAQATSSRRDMAISISTILCKSLLYPPYYTHTSHEDLTTAQSSRTLLALLVLEPHRISSIIG